MTSFVGHFLPILLLALDLRQCRAQVASQLFNVVELPQRVCNDGSPYKFYYRNCSANWDRKPGGPDFCLNQNGTWILHLASSGDIDVTDLQSAVDGAYCYSEGSCATRSVHLTTSTLLKPTSFPDGIVLPFAGEYSATSSSGDGLERETSFTLTPPTASAEANPNLYKSPAVVLPYCTSDLWAGTGNTARVGNATWTFGGSSVMEDVLRLLFSGPQFQGPAGMAGADRVVISGGPGPMARLDDLADTLLTYKRQYSGNASAALQTFGVCDGCLLLDNFQPPFTTQPACDTDSNCPPEKGLPQLEALAGLVRPVWCAGPQATWECYTASSLGPALLAGRTPVLVYQQQYDAVQLAANGVSGINSTATAAVTARAPPSPGLVWAESVFAPAVLQAIGPFNYSFSAACAYPSGISLSSAWYHQAVHQVDSYGHVHNDSMLVAVPSYLEDAAPTGFGPQAYGVYRDTCGSFGCNPSGCAV